MTYAMAIELGTSFTSVYVADNGVVYREPSCVAFCGEKKAKNILAVGFEAKAMQGLSPEKTIVVEPIENGIVSDEEAASLMLRYILRTILPASAFMPRINVLLLVPCGLSIEERRLFEDVCFDAGVKEVTLVEKVVAAAVGCDLPITGAESCFVADIGGGTTDVAAIALGGVVSGVSAELGGGIMDEAISQMALNRHQAQLGLATIEELKNEIGSLLERDTAAVTVGGQDVSSHTPVTCRVTAAELRDAVLPVYQAVADVIESVVNACPPEVAASLSKSGVVLTGGAAKILGLEQLLTARLNLDVYLAPDAEYATIVGGGKLLRDKELLSTVLANN